MLLKRMLVVWESVNIEQPGEKVDGMKLPVLMWGLYSYLRAF